MIEGVSVEEVSQYCVEIASKGGWVASDTSGSRLEFRTAGAGSRRQSIVVWLTQKGQDVALTVEARGARSESFLSEVQQRAAAGMEPTTGSAESKPVDSGETEPSQVDTQPSRDREGALASDKASDPPDGPSSCPACGAPATAGSKFCHECGGDLVAAYRGANEISIDSTASGASPEAQASDTATIKTCPECAEEIKAAAVVCRYCGHRFDDPESSVGASSTGQFASAHSGVSSRPGPTSGFAVAAFVCSLIGLWIAGIPMGYSARGEIDRSDGEKGGRGYATAAIILGWLGLLGTIVIVAVVISAQHKTNASSSGPNFWGTTTGQ